jgi:hypothetical protein
VTQTPTPTTPPNKPSWLSIVNICLTLVSSGGIGLEVVRGCNERAAMNLQRTLDARKQKADAAKVETGIKDAVGYAAYLHSNLRIPPAPPSLWQSTTQP